MFQTYGSWIARSKKTLYSVQSCSSKISHHGSRWLSECWQAKKKHSHSSLENLIFRAVKKRIINPEKTMAMWASYASAVIISVRYRSLKITAPNKLSAYWVLSFLFPYYIREKAQKTFFSSIALFFRTGRNFNNHCFEWLWIIFWMKWACLNFLEEIYLITT